MQGMFFLILNEKGEPVNHGVIARQITPEKYLCQFQVAPVSSRVVPIEELQMYQLFHDRKQMNVFLADNAQRRKAAAAETKKTSKKKAAKKKKVSKKTPRKKTGKDVRISTATGIRSKK